MPVPPLQRAAWSGPKDNIPADLLAATTRLFQQGLADPRGCDYRVVSVGVGSCWSRDASVVECHGWVLPTTEKAAQRFAVCWNGMVYPLVSVGGKADLKADITALLKTEDSTHKARPDQALVLFPEWPSEGESVSEKTILPLKACLLLRLGEGELAARLWRAWPPPDADDAEKRDVYVELSDALKWAMFDRAVCARCAGTIAWVCSRPRPP